MRHVEFSDLSPAEQKEELNLEKRSGEIYFCDVNIRVFCNEKCIDGGSRVLRSYSQEALQKRIDSLPNQLRRAYQNIEEISVQVKSFGFHRYTLEEYAEKVREDDLDTERQMDKWCL